MAHVLTTKELSQYLKLHEITICKYAAEGIIPAFRIGKAWRFDKDVIDNWIYANQTGRRPKEKSKEKDKGAPVGWSALWPN